MHDWQDEGGRPIGTCALVGRANLPLAPEREGAQQGDAAARCVRTAAAGAAHGDDAGDNGRSRV